MSVGSEDDKLMLPNVALLVSNHEMKLPFLSRYQIQDEYLICCILFFRVLLMLSRNKVPLRDGELTC